ncbi:UDP-N-acetyl glucosamine 2-epimerase [Nocardioides sp. SYSU D00065]|uniref:UDP-N-acetyl glucosamine 2-epimerase n=1 Tax=Nocardioides sp. SYSU D00065 TaxID=2817378 RepID=UPI001B33B864|nr:UDP-N-acetylglucosamine 2-epimerase [Nocardioides sp. SYSU D00065]
MSSENSQHIVVVGTKPDIIKQAPIYHELRERGHDVLLCHTGQHYDHNLSQSMLDEFGVREDVNLEVRGGVNDLVSGITAKLSAYLRGIVASGGSPITYVHGDTTTAMAGALASFGERQALVHVEAGLRTLSPTTDVLKGWIEQGADLDWASFRDESVRRDSWSKGSKEPSPEQFNTRVADAGSDLHAAPVELNRDFLVEEGFAPAAIDVVGNSVVDALQQAIDGSDKNQVLEKYPQMGDGSFLRFCVHRRENTTNRERFDLLMDAMEALLEQGHHVLFIRLIGTEAAIDNFGRRQWLADLEERYGDALISTPVWDSYLDVIAAMSMCAVIVTDSGSIQEEANVLEVPCVTLRFGSDRSETFLAGSNFLAPPVSKELMAAVVHQVFEHRGELSWKRVYPEGASSMLVDAVERRLADDSLRISEEWRYGLRARLR